MRGADHPDAVRHWARLHFVDVEQLECRARADDVDDRVEAADLVEVDLLGRTAVEMAFGLGERVERAERAAPHPFRQAGLLDESGDVPRGAHDAALLGVDDDVRRADAAALHRLGVERPPTDGDAPAQLADLVEVGARVDEAAEGHVAGDPAEAVEPRDGRHVRLVM